MQRSSRWTQWVTFASLLFAPLSVNAQGNPTADQAVTVQINTTHTGYISTPGLVPPITMLWSTDLGANVKYPLIAEGKVFALTTASTGPALYALDGKTGAIVWGPVSVPSGSFTDAEFGYDAGRIFVVPESTSSFTSGAMYAYDSGSGALLWSTTLPGQYGFSSPPTAYKGIVYVGGAGSGGTLYAVDESTGNVLWTAAVANGDNSSPAVTDDSVFVSYAGPQSYRFNPATGAQIWHYDSGIEGGGGSTPAYYLNQLYVRDYDDPNNQFGGLILSGTDGTLLSKFDPGFSDAPFPRRSGVRWAISINRLL
jgi:outer membrane protein assembly factor BamB